MGVNIIATDASKQAFPILPHLSHLYPEESDDIYFITLDDFLPFLTELAASDDNVQGSLERLDSYLAGEIDEENFWGCTR